MDLVLKIPLNRIILLNLVLSNCVLLASCSYIPSFKFPGVYKIDVQQGNVINQELADKLRVGMTTKQVRYIMGTPLIVDTFNQHRWDYFYSLKKGKGDYQQKKLILYFKDNKLDSVAGDIVPANLHAAPFTEAKSNNESVSF